MYFQNLSLVYYSALGSLLKTEPQSLQIIKTIDNTVILNEEVLDLILRKEEIKDRYISIISITGVSRHGKSFLLNFLLRYLHVKYVQQRNIRDWLRPEDGLLKGFSWSPGSKQHTIGIHIWSEVFLTELPTGEEVAIILLDTQGMFNNHSSVSDDATIFTLSTLISSVQIYNVMHSIKQYDLAYLQCFGSYSNSMSKNGSSPFQKLMFLVRDWPCPYEKSYGDSGGNMMINELFNSSDILEAYVEINCMKELFSNINCFLLPYPGNIVNASGTFNGCLDDVNKEFKQHIQEFATLLLAPENLVVKTVHGERIRAGELVYYIKEYCKILQDRPLPQMKTIFNATVEAHYKATVHRSMRYYQKMMDCDCKISPRRLSMSELQNKHSLIKLKTIEYYGKIRKFDDPELSDVYLMELQNCLDKEFIEYVRINEKKMSATELSKQSEGQRSAWFANQRRQRRSRDGGSSVTTVNTIEMAGAAAAIAGGVAVLVFGASKLLLSKTHNK